MLEKAKLEWLLDNIAKDLGFYYEPKIIKDLDKLEEITPDNFARLLLEAEGLDPDIELVLRREIRDRFKTVFGG